MEGSLVTIKEVMKEIKIYSKWSEIEGKSEN